jgi:L-amino acid N-acyltransferase YncA
VSDEPEIIYRAAKPTDAVTILALLKRMHRESPVELEPVDDSKALLVIVQAIRDGRWFVAIADRKLVGVIGVVWDEPWWSSVKTPTDLSWYVLPEHRASGIGVALLRMLVDEIPEGYLRMANIAAGAELDDRMEALYHRVAGLRRVGSIYMRGL